MLTSSSLKLGAILCLTAACIAGGWPVITALGMRYSMTPYELVILRVLLAGPLLIPFAFRGDNSIKAWLKAVFLTLIAGATFNLVAAYGFFYAPANHGGVIIPGTSMLFSMLAGHFFLHERLTTLKASGSATIIFGLLALSLGAETKQGIFENSLLGDGLFVAAGLMFGTYSILLRTWLVDPLSTVARIALLSFAGIAVYHLLVQPEIHLFSIPTHMLVTQIVYQGILVSIVAIFLFSKAVTILGAGRANTINSVTPAITLILAFVILREVPNWLEQLGIGAILAGIMLAIWTRKPATIPANS